MPSQKSQSRFAFETPKRPLPSVFLVRAPGWMGCLAALCLLVFGAQAVGWAEEGLEPTPPWDGSRTTPVHRIPLVDEEGQSIIPEYPNSLPFSARYSCGPCHPYETVSAGLHFNASASPSPGAMPERVGEPWVWVDPTTGTQLPLSYRRWAGTWAPEDLGISDWRFTQLFGRHLPGGDMAEPEDPLSDPEARWDVSGKPRS